ncbi:MAG: alpha-L-fucosidase [Gemmatimonadales bacterium]|nr:MAG: alpha-L-fucosidase [Gemmatimonadales bacterium]
MAVALILAAGADPARLPAQSSDTVPQVRLDARERYRSDRFGMFIHWGVYSQLGSGEWVMETRPMNVAEYEWLASDFDPVNFDARAWVDVAKRAGMKYITITARHHDGFSMFDTDATDYDIVDWARYGRDPLAELAEACRAAGLQLFFYYSQLDWRHPDYFPRGRTGHASDRPASGEWSAYLDFMDAQLTELLTRYGPLGGIWFDGMWDKPEADWRLDRTYRLIHELQPQALIIPNHHQDPLPGEDGQTFEQDLPGHNSAGWNTAEISDLPLETSLTMNGSWGFNVTDRRWKSVPELIRYLVRAAGADANLLLNVGPRPDGTLQPEAVERLEAMGEWLADHGESIYGTRGGPFAPRSWGVTTQRGNRVYVHVLDWPDAILSLPPLERCITTAQMLATGETLGFGQDDHGVTLRLPEGATDLVDRVVVLETSERVCSPAR